MNVLAHLAPTKVFHFFEAISAIPRGSGNEQGMVDYLVAFAKERGLSYTTDAHLNVIIEKPATPGYEGKQPFIIQSHTDMVNEKNEGVEHDFETEGLKLYIDGDFVTAQGTTLGADNGIAVAMTLALMDGDYQHPHLKGLFTSNEEAGMDGAKYVDTKHFEDCNYLINLDSSDEGSFTISCAGGQRHQVIIPVTYEKTPAKSSTFSIKISGLEGGHSGIDINKGLGNSNKILARVLHTLEKQDELYLSHITGGLKTNAIPREATAVVTVSSDFEAELRATLTELETTLKKEHRESEKNIHIEVTPAPTPMRVMSFGTTTDVISALMLIPNGVYRLAANGDLVTSSNMGVVSTEGDTVILDNLTRSNINSEKQLIVEQTGALAALLEADHVYDQDKFGGWEFREDSPLREICVAVHKQVTGQEPGLVATHGGLECGIFATRMPHLDIISFGPNNYYLHTPDERLSISSTERVYDYLVALVAAL